LKTTIKAEEHIAEEKFLLEEQTLNKPKSLKYQA
jgi:hypothetical protein